MPENCIIILNYNDSERVIKLVCQISEYNALNHILIVDNCSSDDSYKQLLLLKSDKIDVIQTETNGGYAAGNNFGAEYAIKRWNAEILFFANPDVYFEEETVAAVEKSLFLDERYAVATALVRDGYNVWDIPAYWGTVRMLFLLAFTIHKRQIKKQLLQKAGIREVGVVEGSFFSIRTSTFKEVSGFDERTFLYLEENILAYKLQQKGYKEVINADIFYIHEHSKSISKEYKSKAKAFKLFKPSFVVYLKYYLECDTIKMIVFRLFYFVAYFERILFDIIKRIGIV